MKATAKYIIILLFALYGCSSVPESKTTYGPAGEESAVKISSVNEVVKIGIYITLPILFILIVLVIKQKMKLQAKIKNKQSDQNDAILDGLQLAKKLQETILPDEEKVGEYIPDYFIIFKPRDIVSGDFYWITSDGGYTFAAAVDCTGHGVPGAFMSLIGNTLLNRIINERKIYDPAEILKNMDGNIRDILKQDADNTASNDGMDVALCRIDPNERKVVFSGAHRPLYYFRDGKLEEVKGSLRTIGGRQRNGNNGFYNAEIDICDEILLYLTTDGINDQNNSLGRKFGKKRLKKLLEGISGYPMHEQKGFIQLALDNHQGSNRQRDDITVVGLRIKCSSDQSS